MAFRTTLERTARTLTPKRLRPFVANLYYALIDGVDRLAGRDDPLIPPKRLLRISTSATSDYHATGRALAALLVDRCGLRHDAAVLDVGCGVGRLAVALTDHLATSGRYEGFDIVPEEIEWCRRHISPRFPNFRFQVADLYNKTYHPAGRFPASEYVFPFGDGEFDLVVLASVFTHLLTADAEQYFSEVARVLKPGGRSLASFYLLNDRTLEAIQAGTSAFRFGHTLGRCRIDDPDRPELAVAHDEADVLASLARNGLVVDDVWYGTWSTTGTQTQDLVLVSRIKSFTT